MKKIIFFVLSACIFALFFSIRASAISPTQSSSLSPTPSIKNSLTPTPTSEDKKNTTEENLIQKMKERVAKRVSELKLVEKRGIVGTVKEVSSTQITILDISNKTRIVDIDELTKFNQSGGNTKSFGISDINNGDYLSFIGLYNKDTKRLLARFVTKISSIPSRISGIVKSKDSKAFTITLVTSDEKEQIVDIQTSTAILVFSDDSPKKSGFSKIEEGELMFVVGFPDLKDKNLFLASRIVHFTNLTPSDKLIQAVGATKKDPTPTKEP